MCEGIIIDFIWFYASRIEFKKSHCIVFLRKMSEEWYTPADEEELVEKNDETTEILEVVEDPEELYPEEEEPYLVVPKIPGFDEEEEEIEEAKIVKEIWKEEAKEKEISVEQNFEEVDKKKTSKKFKDLPPKKKTRNMALIFVFTSGLLSLIFSVVYHFTLLNTKTKGALVALPGNFIAEIMILWAAIVIAFFVLLPLIPYMSKLYIFLHKLVKRFNFKYSVVETDEHYYNFKEVLRRVLPVFLISFLFGYWFGEWFFIPNIGDPGSAVNTLIYFLVSFIMMPLTILITSPLWLLNDSGIIAMKIRKEGDRKIPDVEGPTVFFFDFFTGSVTTLVITTLVFFIIDLVGKFEVDVFLGFLFVVLLILPLQIISIIYLYEIFMRKLKKKLHKILPNKLVDKMPKTVVDISAFDPFYIPEISEEKAIEIDPDELKDPKEFLIETEDLSYD